MQQACKIAFNDVFIQQISRLKQTIAYIDSQFEYEPRGGLLVLPVKNRNRKQIKNFILKLFAGLSTLKNQNFQKKFFH